jgi:cyclopropane-fatty-acyl-phospholipid synthase
VQVGATDSAAQESAFALVFRNPEVVSSAVLGRDPLRLAEAYFRGEMDIEGDFFAALALKDHLEALQLSVGEQIGAVATALRLRALNADRRHAHIQWTPSHGRTVKAHSKAENRDAIQFHYDVSNDFYALWLDRAMVYSCAYFENSAVDLDTAQVAKLDHICRKLSLRPGESFLDIGCGWGALVIHAAQRYGVRAHGVTLSPQQLKVAQERIAQAGLTDRVSVELLDYRDLPGESVYDKVASVGMFEHVGLKNLPVYFSTVHRLLKPHGLFLNHGITHNSEGWQRSMSTEFINRYVFPDGELDNISNIQHTMEKAKFEIADVEALRPHYALTLRHWVARLEHNHARALQYVNEATYRVWRLYMTACALEFESGDIGIYQVLATKRAQGNLPVPLTRRYMYT